MLTWERRFSVLSTKSSIFSPRSRTCAGKSTESKDSLFIPISYDLFNYKIKSCALWNFQMKRPQETDKHNHKTKKESPSLFSFNISTQRCLKMPYLFNVFHHDSFNFWDLSFYFSKLVDLLWMIHTILHMLLQFRPTYILWQNFGSNNNETAILSKGAKKTNLPELLVQAVSNCCGSFPSAISLHKIFLDALKKGNWNLSTNSLYCNHAVSCSI